MPHDGQGMKSSGKMRSAVAGIFGVLVIIKRFLAQGCSFSLFDVSGWVAMLGRRYKVHFLLQ